MTRPLAIAALLAALLPPPCFANSMQTMCLIYCQSTSSSSPPEVAFSPDRGATDLVVKTIREARQSVRMAAYSFTSKPIAVALIDAKKHGIDVRVVVDKSNATARYTAATFMANEGVPVRVDYRYAIMHDKFIVVDGETVETGSFNFTAGAEKRNAENVLVLHGDLAVAAKYAGEWERLWGESEEMKARY
jgi:phosphatidylserine/phosphatidylglycerophosphate/cardiolipin synthase-like enzyme